MARLQVEVEMDLAGHPLFVEFSEQSGDETQAGIRVGADAGNARSTAQLAVNSLQPFGGGQPDAAGSIEPDAIVDNDQSHAVQRPDEQALQEVPPVDLGLRNGDVAAEQAAFATRLDANSDQGSAIDDAAFQTRLEVNRIQQKARRLAQVAIAPLSRPLVELGCGTADLGAGKRNFRAEQLLQHLDDTTDGHTLRKRLGQGEMGSPGSSSGAHLQDGRAEIAETHLRHMEGHFAQPGEHGLGLAAVGVVAPCGDALMGSSGDILGALDRGGFIDKNAQGLQQRHPVRSRARPHKRLAGVWFRLAAQEHEVYTLFSKPWRQTHHRAVCWAKLASNTYARPFKKTASNKSRLRHMGHIPMDNRHEKRNQCLLTVIPTRILMTARFSPNDVTSAIARCMWWPRAPTRHEPHRRQEKYVVRETQSQRNNTSRRKTASMKICSTARC